MESKRMLTEMFVAEATMEFPDSEVAAVTRMVQSATRAGRLPRDAAENWPIVQGGSQRVRSAPSSGKPAVRPAAKRAAKGDDTSGRLIPSQSSLRSDPDGGGLSHEPPRALRKFSKGGSATAGDGNDDHEDPPSKASPSLLKRAYSKAKGVDPTNGLPVPKPAAMRVKGGPAKGLPDFGKLSRRQTPVAGNADDDPLAAYPNKEPEDTGDDDFPDEKTDPGYVSPFAHIPGLSGDEPGDDPDPGVSTVRKGLSRAAANGEKPTPRPLAQSQGQANVWDRFAGATGAQRAKPTPKDAEASGGKQQQGRLSRLFKGRRDDGI